jgi:hypothetical protein
MTNINKGSKSDRIENQRTSLFFFSYTRKPVLPLSIKQGLQSFVECLKNRPAQVILIIHNIKAFDCDVLMNALQSSHLQT